MFRKGLFLFVFIAVLIKNSHTGLLSCFATSAKTHPPHPLLGNQYETLKYYAVAVVPTDTEENPFLCGGSLVKNNEIAIPMFCASMINGNTKIIKHVPTHGNTYSFGAVMITKKNVGADKDIAMMKISCADHTWNNRLLEKKLRLEINDHVYGIKFYQNWSSKLNTFFVTRIRRTDITVQSLNGSYPDYAGEPLYHKYQLVGLYKRSSSTPNCYVYSRF